MIVSMITMIITNITLIAHNDTSNNTDDDNHNNDNTSNSDNRTTTTTTDNDNNDNDNDNTAQGCLGAAEEAGGSRAGR